MKHLLYFILITGMAMAETAAIVYQNSPGTIERAGGKSEASALHAVLAEGDTLRTQTATMIVEFTGGTRLKLTEGTAVTFKTMTAQRRISLLTGSVFAKVIKLTGGSTFAVETPAVIAAVRGTEFFFGYGREKDLWLCVNEGAVNVAGPKSAENVKQGEGIFILGGTDITKPKPYGWTKKLNWNMDSEKGDLREKGAVKAAYDTLRRNYD